MLPFPVKIYQFKIFTRATPGSSLVYNKNTDNLWTNMALPWKKNFQQEMILDNFFKIHLRFKNQEEILTFQQGERYNLQVQFLSCGLLHLYLYTVLRLVCAMMTRWPQSFHLTRMNRDINKCEYIAPIWPLYPLLLCLPI